MSYYRQLEFDFRAPKPVELYTPDEILERANEHELPSFYENSKFEGKPAGIHAKDLAQYYSMFVNTKRDGGVIGVGISDGGTLAGCRSLEPQAIDRIEQTGIQYCPDARYVFKRVCFSRADGTRDFVNVIRRHYIETRLVETTDGNAYIRKGASKDKLNEGEKREIRISKGKVSHELEPAVGMVYPDDFDLKLIDQFVEAFHRKKQLDEHHDREEALELCHLGKRTPSGFRPNLACVLAFASDPRKTVPGCRVRFLRFEGETEGSGEHFSPPTHRRRRPRPCLPKRSYCARTGRHSQQDAAPRNSGRTRFSR